MSYRWQGDVRVDELERTFESQGEAEQWLGAFFTDLADAGVGEVSLYEEDRLVYGPMPLDEG